VATTKDELQIIPGVGKSIAADLHSLGIEKVNDLKNKDAKAMYEQLMSQAGSHIDRCVLYVFRCAVYYAENDNPDPEKLKWWNWKDGK
jgi:predicted RecB family nuclease